MKIITNLIFGFLFTSIATYAQSKNTVSLSVHYGANGNFFVQSYDEYGGPGNSISFYKKNFIGIAGGMELKYHINQYSNLQTGYMHSVNKRVINYTNEPTLPRIVIRDFSIRHFENIFYLGYERVFSKKQPFLFFQFGIFYSRTQQQEIDIYSTSVIFDERNFSNSRLEEGGAYIGLHYSRKIDTHFELGIQSRLFYEISSNILAQITLTPTLTYHFSKPKAK